MQKAGRNAYQRRNACQGIDNKLIILEFLLFFLCFLWFTAILLRRNGNEKKWKWAEMEM